MLRPFILFPLFTWMAHGLVQDSNVSRRCVFQTATAFLATPAFAAAPTAFVSGTVTLSPETPTLSDSTPALYITCRPDRADNVPAAILSGTRGKPPPVLAARFENPKFPFEFQLTEENLTTEGVPVDDKYWWSSNDLVVSARWDTDGIAATRSETDLVGRGLFQPGKQVVVPLQGRGAFGKFATRKN